MSKSSRAVKSRPMPGSGAITRAQLSKEVTSVRSIKELAITLLLSIFAVVAVIPLFVILGHVLSQGWSVLSWQLFTELPPPPRVPGGGVGNAIVGTTIVVGIGALVAVPIGVLAAIYTNEIEESPGRKSAFRFVVNVLSGVPSIISGVFVYALLISSGLVGFSAWAGGFALAVLMVPTIVRATEEALALVPADLRAAAAGLGAYRFQTVLQVVVPSALPAIATGVLLGIARAAGETAPLIFTAFFSQYWPSVSLTEPLEGLGEPTATLSVLIFNFAGMPFEAQQKLAWGASFLLVVLIASLSILSRFVLSRAERQK